MLANSTMSGTCKLPGPKFRLLLILALKLEAYKIEFLALIFVLIIDSKQNRPSTEDDLCGNTT